MIRNQFLILTLAGIFCALSGTCTAQAQSISLESSLTKLIEDQQANIGIALCPMGSADALTINNDHQYPMQSVFKFPLAMAVLHLVDEGKLQLDQPVHLMAEDMLKNTWSPLSKQYPEGNVDIPLQKIIDYTVAQSDNTGCDVLFRLIGGPAALQKYLDQLGITGIAVQATEKEMHSSWEVQYRNWTHPSTLTQLLATAFDTQTLSSDSRQLLWDMMEHSVPGAKRIKGKLPENTVVAHKPGTGGTNEEQIQSACNDVGIIVLPDGQKIALAVLVSDSSEEFDQNEKIIADIARVVYDHFVAQGK